MNTAHIPPCHSMRGSSWCLTMWPYSPVSRLMIREAKICEDLNVVLQRWHALMSSQ